MSNMFRDYMNSRNAKNSAGQSIQKEENVDHNDSKGKANLGMLTKDDLIDLLKEQRSW